MKVEVADDNQIFSGVMNILLKVTETVRKRLEYWRKVICICTKNKKDSLFKDILMKNLFKDGTGLCRNKGWDPVHL